MREAKSFVNEFLRSHYGITWKDIGAKGRSTLLAELEHVPCNLCSRDETYTIAERDKYGLRVNTVICKGCGLLYLNPRPSNGSYGRFYEEGGEQGSFYHRKADLNGVNELLRFYYGSDFVMSGQHRRALAKFMADNNIDAPPSPPDEGPAFDHDEDDQLAQHGGVQIDYYAEHIYNEIKDLVPPGGRVLEPGASWGKMLQPWKELHGCEATGVEPKKAAVRLAKERLGLELLQGFSDDRRIPENYFDLVLNTRTINHMLDPCGDLRHAWRWLKPNGVLFVDIQDAVEQARYGSFERKVVELDHPYMFSLRTLSAMVQQAGFKLEQAEIKDRNALRKGRAQPDQIRIVARKSAEPVQVNWPDPLFELTTLFKAQVEFDRVYSAKAEVRQRNLRKSTADERTPKIAQARDRLGRCRPAKIAVEMLKRLGIARPQG